MKFNPYLDRLKCIVQEWARLLLCTFWSGPNRNIYTTNKFDWSIKVIGIGLFVHEKFLIIFWFIIINKLINWNMLLSYNLYISWIYLYIIINCAGILRIDYIHLNKFVFNTRFQFKFNIDLWKLINPLSKHVIDDGSWMIHWISKTNRTIIQFPRVLNSISYDIKCMQNIKKN